MCDILKKCKRCNLDKVLSEYYKKKNSKFGVKSICKECVTIVYKKYSKVKIDTNLPGTKTCTKCNINKELSFFHNSKKGKYGVKSYCKECTLQDAKIYQLENKEKIREYNQQPKFKEYAKQWLSNNPQYKKEYAIINKDHINKLYRIRIKQRLNNDPLFKLKCNIRTLIRNSMFNQFTIKSKKTTEILGCSFEEFKEYIEKQFTPEMNWNNHGTYWHYDHIKPISLAKTKQEVYKLNHYTNFQPLFWRDNLIKGNKY